jgi:hypothetical protein
MRFPSTCFTGRFKIYKKCWCFYLDLFLDAVASAVAAGGEKGRDYYEQQIEKVRK